MMRESGTRYLVLDLDHTLGDFGEVGAYIDAIENVLKRELATRELFRVFVAFSQSFCSPTLRLMKEVHVRKALGQPYRVIMYTNNMNPKPWALGIGLFLEWLISQCITAPSVRTCPLVRSRRFMSTCRTHACAAYDEFLTRNAQSTRCLTVFDAIFGLHVLPDRTLNEPARVTNEKTYEDLVVAMKRAQVYDETHSVLFVDDQLHPGMVVPSGVTYYKIDPYEARFPNGRAFHNLGVLIRKFSDRPADVSQPSCPVASKHKRAGVHVRGCGGDDDGDDEDTGYAVEDWEDDIAYRQSVSSMLLDTMCDDDAGALGTRVTERESYRVPLTSVTAEFLADVSDPTSPFFS